MSKSEQAVFKIIKDHPNCVLLSIYVNDRPVGTAKAYRDKANPNRLKVYPVRIDYPYNKTLDFPAVVWRQNLAWE
jgi:hypothetical protein